MREHPYDKLKDHKYEKGILKSPMNQINYIKNYSWKKECFPDFIWIALIINYYGRKDAFFRISGFFKEIEKLSFKLESLQLSYFFSLTEKQQLEFYEILLKYINVEVLNPLTIIFKNKNHEIFIESFFKEGISVEKKLDILEKVVENFGENKSEGGTDVQYVILAFYFSVKKNIHTTENGKHAFEGLYHYQKTDHNNEKMREYRPIVRSMFGGVKYMIYEQDFEFIKSFWKELLEIGGCKLVYGKYENNYSIDENFIEDVKKEFQKLFIEHTESELEDSKFNVILGSSVYALRILNEIIECNLRNNVMGRLSLRTIIEIYIILKFIHKKENDKPRLWEDYQEYGVGKYKLILIKAREVNGFENSHLKPEMVDALVNEQVDEMFTDVDFRYFENSQIRNKAIEIGEKELYDLYYDYESNYAHGLWGAVRESAMLKCVNPLHLGHNVPDIQLNHGLADVLPDAVMVFKKLLLFINENYQLSEEFLSKYEVEND